VAIACRILTWEDAYYDNPDNCDSSQSMCSQNTLEQIYVGDFSHDPLGLSVAKMSYHVYSLGEGYETMNKLMNLDAV
jgi:hypothetical protein